jgi:hypothetical protein
MNAYGLTLFQMKKPVWVLTLHAGKNIHSGSGFLSTTARGSSLVHGHPRRAENSAVNLNASPSKCFP